MPQAFTNKGISQTTYKDKLRTTFIEIIQNSLFYTISMTTLSGGHDTGTGVVQA